MGEFIGATPRNKLLGLLADKVQGVNDLASKNTVTNALAGLFGIPAIANTANELSYGGALGTGKGMTWKPKGDTVEAAMALLPMIPPVASGASAGAAFVGRKLEPVAERMAVSALERGGLPAEMVKAMAEKTKSPATVWHGSPHKFDKFDSSKIGTGEGNQAYGHGLYLAESPETAKFYQQVALKELQADPYDASVINRFMGKSATPANNSSESLGAYALANANKAPFTYDPVLAMKNLRDKARKSRIPNQWMDALGIEPVAPEVRKSNFDAARKYIRDFSNKTDGTGSVSHLYKVDLPDEQIAKMLDWDKPLSQQAQVLEAAKKSGYLDEAMKAGGFSEKDIASGLMEGRHLLSASRSGSAAESEALRNAGIPGIRYLDGGSRGTGQGTSNYVIFPQNEGMLRILERNGKGILGE